MASRIQSISVIQPDSLASLAERAWECQLTKQPELKERIPQEKWDICKEDIGYHISFLLSAMDMDSKTSFMSYMKWVKVFMSGIGISMESMKVTLQCCEQVLKEALSLDKEKLHVFIEEGIHVLETASDEIPSFIGEDPEMSALATQYLNVLLEGERNVASKIILDAVEEGTSIEEIYVKVFMPAQREIGRLWQTNQISVAEEHYCTAATQLIMSQLYPKIMSTKKSSKTIVATCVAGELHEIGIRMIADIFELNGWDSYYLGANTPTASIIDTLKKRDADILAISATIATNVPNVKDLISSVRADSKLDNLKIIVGGRPFTEDPELEKKVNADGFAANAEKAIERAEEMIC